MKKMGSFALGALILFSTLGLGACGAKDSRIPLYFDGGGSSGNYNSTPSMVQSDANPYPYNTLEKLADEWNAHSEKFRVVINKTSLNGNRGAIPGLLEARTAPDMLFQVGNAVAEDINNGWYVVLDAFLQKPNPYVSGNEHWIDLYDPLEMSTTEGPDGRHYYGNLDKVPLGMLYNEDLLKATGTDKIPETYSEFLAALEGLSSAKSAGTISADTYLPIGTWQEIYLETSVYAGSLSALDTDRNNVVGSSEFAAAFKSGAWGVDTAQFREYVRLCGEKAKYYPSNYLAYNTLTKFAKGEIAVIDGLGSNMLVALRDRRLKFSLKIAPYPALDAAASSFGGKVVKRGSSGLGTSYIVTNTAADKGEDAVAACADFLMYLTAPENNKRMVNDLGLSLPLDVSLSTQAAFAPLVAAYQRDMADPDVVPWAAVNSWNNLGMEYYDYYQTKMKNYYSSPMTAADLETLIS